ncbi:MAG: winged helix-turn-helix domain-containing protein, partial [Xanthomonadales bacterium]|nr:winged helix-turn-helix domain-containing protein [Xanthomonadales bacterium]
MKTRQIKHLLINFDDYSVSSYGVDIKMDHMALDVLKLLLENTGETVQNNHLMDEVWKDKPSSPEVIPAAISRLRKMFKQTGVGEDLITTVHKIGYKLELPKDDVVSDTVKEVVVKRQNNYLLWALWFIGGLLAAYFYLNVPATKEVTEPVERMIRSTSQDSASSLETDEVQLFILRHTEKQEPDAEDPQLSEQGIKRAQYWARVLQDVQFDAVYTTNFK